MSEVKKKSVRPKSTPAPKQKEAAPVEAKKEVMTSEPTVDVPVQPKRANRVDPAAFWRMQHALASVTAAKAEIEAARLTKLYILALIDPKGRVAAAEKKIEEAQKKADAQQKVHQNFKRAIEDHIGRPLANVAIDPDSGEIADIPNTKH